MQANLPRRRYIERRTGGPNQPGITKKNRGCGIPESGRATRDERKWKEMMMQVRAYVCVSEGPCVLSAQEKSKRVREAGGSAWKRVGGACGTQHKGRRKKGVTEEEENGGKDEKIGRAGVFVDRVFFFTVLIREKERKTKKRERGRLGEVVEEESGGRGLGALRERDSMARHG